MPSNPNHSLIHAQIERNYISLCLSHQLKCKHKLHGLTEKKKNWYNENIDKMSWIPCALWAIQKSSIINCNFIWINYSLVYEVFGGFLFFLEAHKGNNEKWLQNLFVLHAGRNIVCLCAYADIKQTTLWSCVVRSRLQVPARHRKKQNAIKIKGAVQDCRIFVCT